MKITGLLPLLLMFVIRIINAKSSIDILSKLGLQTYLGQLAHTERCCLAGNRTSGMATSRVRTDYRTGYRNWIRGASGDW